LQRYVLLQLRGMRSLHHLDAEPSPQVQPDVVSASGAVLRAELGLDAALLAPHG
jgi:hypothetical protein